jgi:hypothetical protein
MNLKQILRTYRIIGSQLAIEFMGGIWSSGGDAGPLVTLIYGVAIASDLSAANAFLIVPTDGVAFTVSSPTNIPPAGRTWLGVYTVKNTSGGALGVLTFGALFKIGAAWVQPANGLSRSILFRSDGTNLIEVGRTAADVTN